jgi:DnaJ-class molecular chaperone
VLELKGTITVDTLKFRYREMAKKHHPDAGGDAGAMATITRAYEQGLQELGS